MQWIVPEFLASNEDIGFKNLQRLLSNPERAKHACNMIIRLIDNGYVEAHIQHRKTQTPIDSAQASKKKEESFQLSSFIEMNVIVSSAQSNYKGKPLQRIIYPGLNCFTVNITKMKKKFCHIFALEQLCLTSRPEHEDFIKKYLLHPFKPIPDNNICKELLENPQIYPTDRKVLQVENQQIRQQQRNKQLLKRLKKHKNRIPKQATNFTNKSSKVSNLIYIKPAPKRKNKINTQTITKDYQPSRR